MSIPTIAFLLALYVAYRVGRWAERVDSESERAQERACRPTPQSDSPAAT